MASESRKRKRADGRLKDLVDERMKLKSLGSNLGSLRGAAQLELQSVLTQATRIAPHPSGGQFNAWVSEHQAVLSLVVAIIAIVAPIVVSHFQTKSIDEKLGGIDKRVSVLKTGLNAVTDTLAPQLRNAVDANLLDAGEAKDRQQRSAALAQTATAITALSVGHVKKEDAELRQIGAKVSNLVDDNPSLTSGWAAIAALINYRSLNANSFVARDLPNCWDTFRSHSEEDISPAADLWDEQIMGNCNLTLDEDATWTDSGFGKTYAKNASLRRNVQLRLHVHDATVTYQGHKLVPFVILECQRCTFVTSVDASPTKTGQKLLMALLRSDIEDVKYVNAEQDALLRRTIFSGPALQ